MVAGRPVWLTRVDGHAGWANTAALQGREVDPPPSDPPGGRIERIAGGTEPAGVLVDAATELVGAPSARAAAGRPRPGLHAAQELLLKHGVTAVADMGTTIEDWQAYRRAGDTGRLRLRIMAYAEGVEHGADRRRRPDALALR